MLGGIPNQEHMRMKLSTLGAAIAAFAVCAAAGAQTTPYEPIGASVRLGIFLPTNSQTNDNVGSGFFAFGADYRLGVKSPRLIGLDSYIDGSVDYFRRNETGAIPVLVNYNVTSGQYFFKVGIGVSFQSLPGDDKAGFGYQVGAGYTIPSTSRLPVFVQASFFGADRSQVNGFGLFVGTRF